MADSLDDAVNDTGLPSGWGQNNILTLGKIAIMSALFLAFIGCLWVAYRVYTRASSNLTKRELDKDLYDIEMQVAQPRRASKYLDNEEPRHQT